ncbi:MAG: o-succinylbenzoate synthase [Phycisphaerae bacterium]|nr:o-succinylbenzoate synthase [Phycisphaerae bacterium]
MRILDFKIKRYDINLAKTLTVGTHHLNSRSGAIISITNPDGLVGYGEVAPLPGLHQETLSQAIAQLKSLKKIISSPELYPSVNFGIELAYFNLSRQIEAPFVNTPKQPVAINALIIPNENIITEVQNLIEQNFSTIKIKVGRQPLSDDITTIQQIQKLTDGKVKLRLDANRNFSLSDVNTLTDAIDLNSIEYIEEPLKNIADLNAVKMPVALDETLAECDPWNINNIAIVDALILKPAILGGLKRSAMLINWARQNNKKICLSSTFESSLTLEALAAFAIKHNISTTAHGLDTAKWFAQDILTPPLTIINGAINISQQPPIPDMDLLHDL